MSVTIPGRGFGELAVWSLCPPHANAEPVPVGGPAPQWLELCSSQRLPRRRRRDGTPARPTPRRPTIAPRWRRCLRLPRGIRSEPVPAAAVGCTAADCTARGDHVTRQVLLQPHMPELVERSAAPQQPQLLHVGQERGSRRGNRPVAGSQTRAAPATGPTPSRPAPPRTVASTPPPDPNRRTGPRATYPATTISCVTRHGCGWTAAAAPVPAQCADPCAGEHH